MIVCDPRNAPRYAWSLLGRYQGLRWWIRGVYEGRIRVSEIWETRPWNW